MGLRVLVVEDEPKIAKSIGLALESAGYSVLLAGDGERGFFLGMTESIDLLILDRGLPDRDGVEVLRELRRQGRSMPALLVTARTEVNDRVSGLEAGADDYIPKPFAMEELLARVRALLRRAGRDAPATNISIGPLRLHLLDRRCEFIHETLALTRVEWDLLVLLAKAAGACVTRDAITHHLWPEQQRNESTDNLIEVHVRRLRKKLEVCQGRVQVVTVRGFGYRLEAT